VASKLASNLNVAAINLYSRYKRRKYHAQESGGKNYRNPWTDKEVVVSNGVVTSRKPHDIPAFNREMIELFSKGATGSGKPVQKSRLNETFLTTGPQHLADCGPTFLRGGLCSAVHPTLNRNRVPFGQLFCGTKVTFSGGPARFTL
jgi:hypothetical protein